MHADGCRCFECIARENGMPPMKLMTETIVKGEGMWDAQRLLPVGTVVHVAPPPPPAAPTEHSLRLGRMWDTLLRVQQGKAVQVTHRDMQDYTEAVNAANAAVATPLTAEPTTGQAVAQDAKNWCAYVAGIIGTYIGFGNPTPEGIAGIIERRLMFLPAPHRPAEPTADARDAALRAAILALPVLRADEIDGEESDGTPRHWRNRPYVSLTKLMRLLDAARAAIKGDTA